MCWVKDPRDSGRTLTLFIYLGFPFKGILKYSPRESRTSNPSLVFTPRALAFTQAPGSLAPPHGTSPPSPSHYVSIPQAILRRNFLKANLAQLPHSKRFLTLFHECFVGQLSVLKRFQLESLVQFAGILLPHYVLGRFTHLMSLTLTASEFTAPDYSLIALVIFPS